MDDLIFAVKQVEVTTYIRNTPLLPHETILTDFNIPTTQIEKIEVYPHSHALCSCNLEKWIIDITLKDKQLISIHFPIETTEEQIMLFIKPLVKSEY